MSDPIYDLWNSLLQKIALADLDSKNFDQAIKYELNHNPELVSLLEKDRRLLQINLGQSKGYQVLVEAGATANISNHYHFDTELLIKTLGNAIDRIALKHKPVGIPQNLPRSGIVKFVGREEKLEELDVQLQHNDRVAITAVVGMGGVGKTELVLQYSINQLQQRKYISSLCWLRARNQVIATQIITFAQTKLGLNIPEQLEIAAKVEYCWQHWIDGESLIIIDDVMDYKAIEEYLPPPDPRFKLLITTRLDLGKSFNIIRINELDECNSILLLESLLGQDRVQLQYNEAKILCRSVGYLPLALELLGRFLSQKPDWTIIKLQNALNEKSLEIIALSSPEYGMTAKHGLIATLELSWQDLDKPEQDLACLLSLFSDVPILWSLVENCFITTQSDDLEDYRDRGLINRHLLKRVGNRTYQLHQIIQEFFRIKMKQSTQDLSQNKLFLQFSSVMRSKAQEISSGYGNENNKDEKWNEINWLVCHIEENFDQCMNLGIYDVAAYLEVGIAYYLTSVGLYHRVISKCNSLDGKISNSLLEIYRLQYLGISYKNIALYKNSIYYYSQLIKFAQKNDLPRWISATSLNLGNCYFDIGQTNRAIKLYEYSKKIAEKDNSFSKEDECRYKNSLGLCYARQGKFIEAIKLYKDVLKVSQNDKRKVDHGISLNNLCDSYRALLNHKLALHYGYKAIKVFESIFDLFNIGIVYHNFAIIYLNKGDYKLASEYANKGISIGKEIKNSRLLSENYSALSCILLLMSNNKDAKENACLAIEYNYPQNDYFAHLLLIIAKINQDINIQGCVETLHSVLNELVKLITYDSNNYNVVYSYWLTICTLSIYSNSEHRKIIENPTLSKILVNLKSLKKQIPRKCYFEMIYDLLLKLDKHNILIEFKIC